MAGTRGRGAKLDLDLLKSLALLLSERGIGRAAEQRGLAPPAVSTQLRHLRRIFNDPLLETPRCGDMQLTPRARALEIPLARLLDAFDALTDEAEPFDPATTDRAFTIALAEYCHSVIAGPLIARVHALAPRVRLDLLSINAQYFSEDVERQGIDFLVGGSAIISDTLKAVSLFDDRVVLLQRRGLAPAGAVPTLDQLCAFDYLSVKFMPGTLSMPLDIALTGLGRARRIKAQVASYAAAAIAIEGSDLRADIPFRAARGFADRLDIVELPIPVSGFDVRLAWHEQHQDDPGHRWLRNLIVRTARDLP